MNPQTQDNIEVGYSTTRVLKLAVAGIVMTLLSAAMAFNWYGEKQVDGFHVFVGYFGVVFFGLGTCKFVWTSLTARGPVLFISRYGIRDLRIAAELILWSSIAGISTWQYGRQKFIVLATKPELEQQLFSGRAKQAMRLASKAAGVDGVSISPAGLAIGADTLLRMCQEHYFAAKLKRAMRPQTVSASRATEANGERSATFTPAPHRCL